LIRSILLFSFLSLASPPLAALSDESPSMVYVNPGQRPGENSCFLTDKETAVQCVIVKEIGVPFWRPHYQTSIGVMSSCVVRVQTEDGTLYDAIQCLERCAPDELLVCHIL
jgi:hypothetical protein